MLALGRFQTLKVLKDAGPGFYLDGGDGEEILLPRKEAPKSLKPGDEINVFIHLDSEDRPIATTKKPLAQVGEFALMKVVAVERIGAFLDWGLPKDLFLPFAEQSRNLRIGDSVIVHVGLDKSSRLVASMRIERNLPEDRPELKVGEAVELMLFGKTDLGYKALINQHSVGVIYHNEVFKPLRYGQKMRGYIKKLRDDGKIDLSLQALGHVGAQEEIGPRILEALRQNDGYLEINDKASAELIHQLFGVSKKKFKIALGDLYKKRLVRVEDDGVYLASDHCD